MSVGQLEIDDGGEIKSTRQLEHVPETNPLLRAAAWSKENRMGRVETGKRRQIGRIGVNWI
jgi:hypothetical protein